MEGEAKGEGHGDGGPAAVGPSVPLRRWEDWERSRLRKLRREEKRRREFERLHGSYMTANGELLTVRSEIHSQYDGSDTMSVTSSEDDHWGSQIGGYNENHPQYPPPPVGLMTHALPSTESIAASEMEAMLERGFDDRSSNSSSRPGGANGYTPLARAGSPGFISPISPTRPIDGVSSAAEEHRTHAKKRSGGRPGQHEYGPLGPLDPSSQF